MSRRGAENERHPCNCGRLSNDHFLPPLGRAARGDPQAQTRRRPTPSTPLPFNETIQYDNKCP
jgi:hypothetical protein